RRSGRGGTEWRASALSTAPAHPTTATPRGRSHALLLWPAALHAPWRAGGQPIDCAASGQDAAREVRMRTSRRGLLIGSGVLAAGAAPLAQAAPAAADAAWLQGALERYVGFGIKASGGPGDTASGAWLEGDL